MFIFVIENNGKGTILHVRLMIEEHDIECTRKGIIRYYNIALEMKLVDIDIFCVLKSKKVTVSLSSLSSSSSSSLPSILSRS